MVAAQTRGVPPAFAQLWQPEFLCIRNHQCVVCRRPASTTAFVGSLSATPLIGDYTTYFEVSSLLFAAAMGFGHNGNTAKLRVM